MGYAPVEKTINAAIEERISLNIVMEPTNLEIGEVQVTEQRRNGGGHVRINPRLTSNLPSAGGAEQ
jgi:hypothetical protein